MLEAFFVVGAVAMTVTNLLPGHDLVHDDEETHSRLAAQFGNAAWYQHLVAANTFHEGFVVYLDTRDAAVQALTCTDLKPMADEVGRAPDLYYANGGEVRFVRSC